MGFADPGRLPGGDRAWVLGGIGISGLGKIPALGFLCGMLDIYFPVFPYLRLLQESKDPSGKEGTEVELTGVDRTIETIKF